MTVLDANLLLYAYNADSPSHAKAARWLKDLLASGEPIALPWLTIWAFIRISTNPRIFANPLSADRVFAIVKEWLTQPGVLILEPGPGHAEILKRLMVAYNANGPLVTDAVMAALSLEHGAALASTDQDFRRFPELRWINPLSR